jgi:hypothetical protein
MTREKDKRLIAQSGVRHASTWCESMRDGNDGAERLAEDRLCSESWRVDRAARERDVEGAGGKRFQGKLVATVVNVDFDCRYRAPEAAQYRRQHVIRS